MKSFFCCFLLVCDLELALGYKFLPSDGIKRIHVSDVALGTKWLNTLPRSNAADSDLGSTCRLSVPRFETMPVPPHLNCVAGWGDVADT